MIFSWSSEFHVSLHFVWVIPKPLEVCGPAKLGRARSQTELKLSRNSPKISYHAQKLFLQHSKTCNSCRTELLCLFSGLSTLHSRKTYRKHFFFSEGKVAGVTYFAVFMGISCVIKCDDPSSNATLAVFKPVRKIYNQKILPKVFRELAFGMKCVLHWLVKTLGSFRQNHVSCHLPFQFVDEFKKYAPRVVYSVNFFSQE